MTPEQPTGRKPSAIPQARKFGPDHILGDTAPAGRGVEAAIGPGQHPRRIANHGGNALDTVRHHFRVLDEIGQAVDDAGDQDLVVGERVF